MTLYRTSRRSGAKPTMSYAQRLIKDAMADGSQLKLIDMERKGYVTYIPKNGTYTLTEAGRDFLIGGRR